jgi:predicted O-methyltransferase YrrM
MAVSYPHESLIDSHVDGCTEPYIAEAVCALIKAKQRPDLFVFETGGFRGTTSAWIALTLKEMGGGTVWVCEIDPVRRDAIADRLSALPLDGVEWFANNVNALRAIDVFTPQCIDVAWVDDDHQKHHVEQEINALWPKMKPGGLMLFHDVSSDGVCQLGPLIRKYGGIAMDFPRLGPDGGLGIIPIPK